MARYNDVTFPPHDSWDPRLEDIACPALLPVEKLHENPWFSVNNRGGYYTIEYHRSQVAVLPVVAGTSVVLVRVKRPVINDFTLELPAGAVEVGEEPAYAASRELREEAGIAVPQLGRYVPLPPVAISSSRMPRLSYIFRIDITEEEFMARGPHDDEIHSIERVPVDQLARLMSSGRIYVSLSLAVLGVFLTSNLA